MYRIGQEEIDAVSRVIKSKNLFKCNDGLQETMHCEKELREMFNCENAILMTSGKAALISALTALEIGPGDEVIVPAYTYMATGVYSVSEACAGHGCYFNFEINGSKASLRWNQEENDRLWMGFRDGDNRFIIRNPNTISSEAKAYTNLAMGHPEGWNDAFKGNIYSFYKYIADGLKDHPLFSTLEDAAYIVKLTEAIIESGHSKKWVEVC